MLRTVDGTGLVRAVGQAAENAGNEIAWVQDLRDLGPQVWAAAVAGAAAWWLLVGLGSVKVRPRRVRSGPDVFDPPGEDSPAVVNLITNGWRLDRGVAPAATLVDLAARGHLSVLQVGDGATSVHVSAEARAGREDLTQYEEMVLAHVEGLAGRTRDRVVPAGALTTGSGSEAKLWWGRFRAAVHREAKERGLARRRWSGWTLTFLAVAGLPAAVPFGAALATAVYDGPYDTDRDLANGVPWYSLIGWIAPLVVVGAIAARRAVADTASGRDLAATWLGLRSKLSRDPMLGDLDATGVSMRGRVLAYGIALGVADQAADAVQLGPEDSRELWSSMSGRWRKVRVRYPRRLGSEGKPPAVAIFTGLFLLGIPAMWFGMMVSIDPDGDVFSSVRPEMWPLLAPGGLLGVFGLFLVLRALADMAWARQPFEGRVLRLLDRSSSKSEAWLLVVDDGVSDALRAWKLSRQPHCAKGAKVQGEAYRFGRHVRSLQVLEQADGSVAPPGRKDALAVSASPSSGSGLCPELNVAFSAKSSSNSLTPPPGPLPDADQLAAVFNQAVTLDPLVEHELIQQGIAAAYRVGDGWAQLMWLTPQQYWAAGRPRFLHDRVDGLGEEAFRRKTADLLITKVGDIGFLVVLHLPNVSRKMKRQLTEQVARTALGSLSRVAG